MYANPGDATARPPSRGSAAYTGIGLAVLFLCFGAAAYFALSPATWHAFVTANLIAGAAVVLLWWRGAVSLQVVVVVALLLRLTYLWLPPLLSDDVYRYIWDGLLQTRGINPFAYTPDDARLAFLHGEPIYEALNSASYHTVYPPLSQLLFRVGAWFYEADWKASYYVIKGLLAGCETAAMLLLARRLPARQLMLYAWNPLVLLAAAGQAHSESLAVLCLVAAWLLARSGRGGWAAGALAGAGLVKLYPFVLFPLLWRRFGWVSVWPGALVTGLLCLPFAHPNAVAHMLSSLELYVRSFEFNAGMYYGVKKIFEVATGTDWSKQIGPAFRWLYLLSLPLVYALDWRQGWTFRRAAVVVVGLFFVFSTTVHPWYLLPLLALVAASATPSWHWHWLGLASIGTYLLYAGGPYWVWVMIGWCGWGILLIIRNVGPVLDLIMRRRALRKYELVAPHMPCVEQPTILDLGAGEGFVGSELASRFNGQVTLVDIRDINRTSLTLTLYNGRRLPFGDDAFDVVLLVYVLHHANDPQAVMDEARRVCRGRIIILESIYGTRLQRIILSALDRLANHLRSAGAMAAWTETLHFETFEGWKASFVKQQLRTVVARDLGGIIHRRAVYVLEP